MILNLIPFHQKNYLEVVMYGLMAVIAFFINPVFGFVLLHLAGVIIWSLRAKAREFSKNAANYISPVDGKIISVDQRFVRNGVECVKIAIETGFTDSHVQYSPISGSIVSAKIGENQEELSGVGSGFRMVYESKLSTDVVDTKTNMSCFVETNAKLFFGLPVVPIEPVEYQVNFIEQGSQIGVWHCLPCSSFITYVYLDAGADVDVSAGYRVFGGQTVLASRPELLPLGS